MKKKLFLLATVSLLILAGCGNNPPSLAERAKEMQQNTNQEYQFTGMIEPIQINLYQQGTHQVRTDDGRVILIQSKVVNLSEYLDKRVTLKGKYAPSIAGQEQVLDVTEVNEEQASVSGELQNYENKAAGYRFQYPGDWTLEELGKTVSLSKDDTKWVTIETISTDQDLNTFVASREAEDGTPVTIGAQRSLRYTDGESVKLYVPNPSKNMVYLITFNAEKKDATETKPIFYSFLETFMPEYFAKPEGDKCGGTDRLKCGEGFRCELNSGEADAEGVCVALGAGTEGQPCPFVSPPDNCNNYEVGQLSNTGCPVRYNCLDNGPVSGQETTGNKESIPSVSTFDQGALISSVEAFKDDLLHVKGAQILQYELTDSANLIAVIYRDTEKQFKTLFSYATSGKGFNFIEKAHFEEGTNQDWVLISGENLQRGLPKTVIKSEGDVPPQPVSEGKELYENPRIGFSLEYPKSWYFRSFGAIGDSLWTVGFADKSVEVLSDASILVRVFDKTPAKAPSGTYRATHDKEGKTYTVEGPQTLSETIDGMAASIQ